MDVATRSEMQGRVLTRLIVFLLVCYGMTNVLTGGKIFAWLQKAHYFFRCPMCLGFWVGGGVGLLGVYRVPCEISGYPGIAIGCVLGGFLSSGFCWAMRVALHRLGEDEL